MANFNPEYVQALLAEIVPWLSSRTELRLYINDDVEPDDFDPASFEEAGFEGYGPIALTSWGPAVLVEDDELARTLHPIVTFTREEGGTSETVQGYYLTDTFNDQVVWHEPLSSGPVDMDEVGKLLVLKPKLELRLRCPEEE